MTVLDTVYLSGCNYQIGYDLLSQSVAGNYSSVRVYGVLNVTNNYVSWSRGTAQVWSTSVGIGTYYSRGSYTLVSEDLILYHDASGNCSVTVTGSLNTTFVSGSCSAIMTLPSIPRQATITNAPNFNDESNPTINYSNPLGNNATELKACISLTGAIDDIPYRDISKTGSSYTFNLTTQERNILRNATPTSNTRKVSFFVYTKIGTSGYYSSVEKTFSIINGNPVFNDFDFEETNETAKALTGSTLNNVININGYSNIKATISTTNKAEAVKQATMSKYRLTIGNSSIDAAYSNEEVSLSLNGAANGTYNVYAIDSRNNSTLVTKLATQEINYENIYINKQQSSVVRDNNQVGENAVLTLNGTLWNNNFGNVVNSIKNVTYRFKKTDSSTWIDGTTTITPTVNQNNFTFTGMIASNNQDTTWDLGSSYNIEITVEDELSSATVDFILNSSVPTLSLDKQGVGIMCAYDENLGGQLQVGGKIVSTPEILWTNPNPNQPFTSQTITLSSDDYDYLELYYYDWNDQNVGYKHLLCQKLLKGYSTQMMMSLVYNGLGYSGTRRFIRQDDTTYLVGTGYTIIDNSQLVVQTQNIWNVPVYVIGYKTGLF